MWAREHYRISRPRILAECRQRRLKQGSFVLLCFVLFAFSGLCLVLVMSVSDLSSFSVFSSVYRREWHCVTYLCWCAVRNLLTHPLTALLWCGGRPVSSGSKSQPAFHSLWRKNSAWFVITHHAVPRSTLNTARNGEAAIAPPPHSPSHPRHLWACPFDTEIDNDIGHGQHWAWAWHWQWRRW